MISDIAYDFWKQDDNEQLEGFILMERAYVERLILDYMPNMDVDNMSKDDLAHEYKEITNQIIEVEWWITYN